MTKKYTYDHVYHEYAARISKASAETIIQILKSILSIESVLDVGCARGTWLSVWRDSGVKVYEGIDGDYLDPQSLLIEPDYFMGRDLSHPFALMRKYDLVQSLEVAEHLPKDRAAGFVSDLAAHGNVILFSAAPPGQGGENHINERPYDYWHDLFSAEGFTLIDCLRPILHHLSYISPWYRYNMFLFIRQEQLLLMPPFLRWFEIKKGHSISDVSPWSYRLRKTMIRLLPFFACQCLAKLQARQVP